MINNSQKLVSPEDEASRITVVLDEEPEKQEASEVQKKPTAPRIPDIPRPITVVQKSRNAYGSALGRLQQRTYRADYETALRDNRALEAQLLLSVAELAGIDLRDIEAKIREEIEGDEDRIHHFNRLLDDVHSGKDELIGLS